jgi:hypothetical protein
VTVPTDKDDRVVYTFACRNADCGCKFEGEYAPGGPLGTKCPMCGRGAELVFDEEPLGGPL